MRLAWQQIPSTIVSEILCLNELDGVVLDTEHASFNKETLYACIQIITLKNKQCFVRLTDVDKTQIRYCLDAGATGLIFSTFETKKQIEDINKYAFYPNKGARGLGLVRENNWGQKPLIDATPKIILQIETIKGVYLLEDISSDNFDYIMIGPYDLSASIGCPGDFQNPNFIKAIENIKNKVPKSKLGIHLPKDVESQIKAYKDFGFIALGMDTIAILKYMKSLEEL